MTTTTKEKTIRITSGLHPEEYLQASLVSLLDWSACYNELFQRLHPAGFFCSCGSGERHSHGYTNAKFPVYMCKACGRTYSILSGTPFSGTKLGAKELVLFMRLWALGSTPPDISKHIGLHKSSVIQLQDKLRIYRQYSEVVQ